MSVCFGKIRYATEDAAARSASNHRDHGMRVYLCPKGAHYHLTSEIGTVVKVKPPKKNAWRKSAKAWNRKQSAS